MDPQSLLAPPTPEGLPAPLWFLTFFKVVGFVLHLGPMHLWYAGLPVAAVLLFRGPDHGRRLARRLLGVLPFAVALGVNFGIVPLLFVQVSHYRVYYPAGILMAWPWFLVIPLLTIAYYAIYYAAVQARREELDRRGRGAVVLAAALMVLIGFLFTNNFSLMTHVHGWSGIFERTQIAGAVTGLALNTADPTLVPRWLLMFGLALMTVGAFVAVDTHLLAGSESEEYRAWARATAVRLYALGLVVFGLMGAWYVFGALPAPLRPSTQAPGWLALHAAAALAPGIGLLAMVAQARGQSPKLAWSALAAHYLVLALNAVARQVQQTREVADYGILGADPVRTQWSTLPLFLVCFVVALGMVGWMLRRAWVEWHTT